MKIFFKGLKNCFTWSMTIHKQFCHLFQGYAFRERLDIDRGVGGTHPRGPLLLVGPPRRRLYAARRLTH